MMMDTSDLPVNIDSPRLLRSVTKKLQEQALGSSFVSPSIDFHLNVGENFRETTICLRRGKTKR